MLKKIVLLGVFVLICIGAGLYGVIRESSNSGWFDGLYVIAFVVPSAAMLLPLPHFAFLRKRRNKRARDLTSALSPALLNLSGMIAALIYYQWPGEWFSALALCLLISALLGAVSLLFSRLYLSFFR